MNIHNWIAPGEFRYCGCGKYLLPRDVTLCAFCKHQPRLEDFACGICGKPAAMFFVHGHRCESHAFQKEPSDLVSAKVLCTLSRMISPQSIRQEEIDCKETHAQLSEERDSFAKRRQASGVKPLFWLE